MKYSQGLDPTLILTETEDEDEDEGDASFDSTSSYFLGEVGELELEVEAATGTPQWAEVQGVLSHLLASLATPGTHSPLVVAEAAAAITAINPNISNTAATNAIMEVEAMFDGVQKEEEEEGGSSGEEVEEVESSGEATGRAMEKVVLPPWEVGGDWLKDMLAKVDTMGLEELEELIAVGTKRLTELEVKERGLEERLDWLVEMEEREGEVGLEEWLTYQDFVKEVQKME